MKRSITIKSYVFLRRLPLYFFIPLVLIFNLTFCIIATSIGLDFNADNIFGSESFATMMILGCIIAPLLETFLIQYLPMELFKNKLKNKILARILLSAVLFSIGHRYNFHYMIAAFFMGLSFATAYAIQRKKSNRTYAFSIVCLIHFIWNFFVILDLYRM